MDAREIAQALRKGVEDGLLKFAVRVTPHFTVGSVEVDVELMWLDDDGEWNTALRGSDNCKLYLE